MKEEMLLQYQIPNVI